MTGHRWTFPVLRHRVIDGDTVEVTLDLGWGLRVISGCRLMNVDTPERHTSAGRLVSQVVDLVLANQHPLLCESIDQGKYRGRFVGDVMLPGGDRLTDYLWEQQLCRVYDGGQRQPWAEAELRRIEQSARHIVDILTLRGT